jgi:hypothetical protein
MEIEVVTKTDEVLLILNNNQSINKGNAKRGISPHLKIRPCDLDL